MDVETGAIEAFGAPLAYDISGSGAPLVLVHAGIADRRMFDELVPGLAHSARVIRYDLHGFGGSGSPAEPYSHHEALRVLLTALGISRATILGVSLGGNVALDLALTRPAIVERLVLVSTGLDGYPLGEQTAALVASMADAFREGDFVRAIDLAVRLWVDGPSRSPDEVDSSVRERMRAMYTGVLRRSRDAGRPADRLSPPALDRLAEVACTTIVVVGAGDLPDVVAEADLLVSSIADARLITIQAVGHMLAMERPAALAELVLAAAE
jgi:3-oxoadipate enol-lactonase